MAFCLLAFTFLAFFMFDLVAGAKVAAAEYLLTGAGLVLFFVVLLAFAEVVGFMGAYLIAAGAITGLLTAYSAAVLKSWLRARFIGGLLVGLYATLYVLLSLEAYSLLIGSLLLFVALAVVMWATRTINWSSAKLESYQAQLPVASKPAARRKEPNASATSSD
jgi:inner membrane protein